MNLSHLLPLVDGWQTLAQAENALRRGRRAVLVEGTPLAAKGLFLAHAATKLERPLVLITYTEEQAARLAEDLGRLLPEGAIVRTLPSSLPLLLDDAESGRDIGRAGRRMATLTALANGDPTAAVVTTATALLQEVPPPSAIKNRRLVLTSGESVNVDQVALRLNAFGYAREDQVNLPGSFARRGDLLDVFPSDGDLPVRIDLFGDDIESIRPFDRETQRSEGKIDSVTLVAAHEVFFTRESIARASGELRKRLVARLAAMKASNEIPERLDRLRENAEADITRIEQAAYFAGIERYLPDLHPDAVCALDYLPTDAIVVLDEPAQMESHADRDVEQILTNLRGRAERGEILPVHGELCQGFEKTLRAILEDRQALVFALIARSLPWLAADEHLHTSGAPAESFAGKPTALADALDTGLKNGVRTVVVSAQAPRVRAILQDRELPESPLQGLFFPLPPAPSPPPASGYPAGGEGESGKAKNLSPEEAVRNSKTPPLPQPGTRLRVEERGPGGEGNRGGIALVNGILRSGFRLTDARLAFLTDAEIFGNASDRAKGKRREFREGMRITSLLELKVGDFVVHIHHGIGLYQGLVKMAVQGVEKEYLLIQYDGGDKLYVPVDQVDRVQKYIGSEGAPPTVNKLGGTEWVKTTAKAQRQAREIAGELIQLYAARMASPGHAYGEDTPWQREMEDAFPYTETPDQQAAIDDVKRDLEAPLPMDRLICGDVGYGKTEVAIRAAFKVASEGRQVAVLCPTTVLTAQHFNTFSERLAAFPLKVDMLSRFRSPKEQAQTLDAIRAGAVDVVIGTHRLLSKDLEFKDLGLVIVDEEQRFGVTHKERLKQIRKSVDVLTMTATPIPRTLQMSLSGIRDLSLINDPPEGRTPVKTFIKEYDDGLIREAILREIDRGGQVYFIHNRVESIRHVAARLERLVPEARFRVGHGQMGEDALEEVMIDFYEHKFDVLVCTTIVESGLDIANTNTMIIDQADKFGLAQLYQLRGRVGRSPRQAYALLMYQRNKILSTIAEQRLGALREFSELGSGYKIALRDMELRGAGSLLGSEQSGTVATVGLDLYMQLLEQAVREYKGEPEDKQTVPLPTVDLPVAAAIPEKYVPGEPQRILMYKKLAAVRNREDVSRLQEEFEDRFGDPPPPVWNALGLLRLRLRSQEIGIESITAEAAKVTIAFKKDVKLPPHTLKPLTAAYRALRHEFTPDKVTLQITGSKILQTVEEMVEVLARALVEPAPPRVSPGGSGLDGAGQRKRQATVTRR